MSSYVNTEAVDEDRSGKQERTRTRADRMSFTRRLRRQLQTNGVLPPDDPNPVTTEGTYWNGERTTAKRVLVTVGESNAPMSWCRDLLGQERRAVDVQYYDMRYLLDDEDGSGWHKVTVGRGGPSYGHRELPDNSVVLRELEADEVSVWPASVVTP